MFPADPADSAACPREQPCLSCSHLSPYAGGPVSCLLLSIGCSTQHAGRGASWDLHWGMQECPRKETQHMGAIGEERRRFVIWAKMLLDALIYRPPLSGQGKGTWGFDASCTYSRGRQLVHICFTLDSFSLSDKALPHFFLLISHMHIHRGCSDLLLMQYCRWVSPTKNMIRKDFYQWETNPCPAYKVVSKGTRLWFAGDQSINLLLLII